jgi:hypothetical protein
MIVGTCLLDLRIPGCRSLKDKRHVLKSLKDSIRRKFNVSIAEIDHLDSWQMASIGLAAAASDVRFANQVISKIVNTIEMNPSIQVIDYTVEIR